MAAGGYQRVTLALRYQLTTYDASYLELAMRCGLELASGDHNMIQAARSMKIARFEP